MYLLKDSMFNFSKVKITIKKGRKEYIGCLKEHYLVTKEAFTLLRNFDAFKNKNLDHSLRVPILRQPRCPYTPPL
jgi:hypothetical protein